MRLFVAAWPPASVLDEIASIERPTVAGVRWTARDQWHVTLRFLGEMDSADPVLEALRAVALPAADAALGDRVERLGRGVLCVTVGGLDRLAGAVTVTTAALGRPPETRPFHGHLTLARAQGRGRGGRGADLRPLAGAPVAPHRFAVSSVAVVRSHLGQAGAHYETIAEVACD